jgi:hypothetical protein
MKSNSMIKAVWRWCCLFLCSQTGCSAQWTSVVLADLPVLTIMELNVPSLVATLQSEKQLSLADATAIQNISAEASRDSNFLEALHNQYKASPSAAGLQKIEDVIAALNTNLPASLLAAHIVDPTLSARITAAVNLILATVISFASLIPETAAPALGRIGGAKKIVIPVQKI